MKLADALNKLEDIVSRLEDGETGMEDAFKLYRQGVELSVQINEKLKTIEKDVVMLNETVRGAFEEVEFDHMLQEEDIE